MLFKIILPLALAALATAQRRPSSSCSVTTRTTTPSSTRRGQIRTPTVFVTSACTSTSTVSTCTRTPTVTISRTSTVSTCTRTPSPSTVTVTVSRTSTTTATATATPGVLGIYVFEDPLCAIPAVGRNRDDPEGELILLPAPARGQTQGECFGFAEPITALLFQDYPDGLRLADRGCSFIAYTNGNCNNNGGQRVTISLDGNREQTCQDPAGLDNMNSGRIECSRALVGDDGN